MGHLNRKTSEAKLRDSVNHTLKRSFPGISVSGGNPGSHTGFLSLAVATPIRRLHSPALSTLLSDSSWVSSLLPVASFSRPASFPSLSFGELPVGLLSQRLHKPVSVYQKLPLGWLYHPCCQPSDTSVTLPCKGNSHPKSPSGTYLNSPLQVHHSAVTF